MNLRANATRTPIHLAHRLDFLEPNAARIQVQKRKSRGLTACTSTDKTLSVYQPAEAQSRGVNAFFTRATDVEPRSQSPGP